MLNLGKENTVWHISPERLPVPALIYAALELAKKWEEKNESNTKLDTLSNNPLPTHLSLRAPTSF